jgi:hypothetical protein
MTWLGMESNPRPSGLQHSASTTHASGHNIIGTQETKSNCLDENDG